jgi:hypothetical protein
MYFPHDHFNQAHQHTLNNWLGLSTACLDAGQRISSLLATASRESLLDTGRHIARFTKGEFDGLANLPAALWLNHSARSIKLLDEAFATLGETHKFLIQSAEAQVAAFDEIVFGTIDRSAKYSPWEIEIAFKAMHDTLESAEITLHQIGEAATQTVDLAEQEVHQISASLTENSGEPKPAKRGRKTSTKHPA